jgi:hypothetical protein
MMMDYTDKYSSENDYMANTNPYSAMQTQPEQRPKFDWNQLLKSLLTSGLVSSTSGNRGLGMLSGMFAPQIEKWLSALTTKKKNTPASSIQPVGPGNVYTGQ